MAEMNQNQGNPDFQGTRSNQGNRTDKKLNQQGQTPGAAGTPEDNEDQDEAARGGSPVNRTTSRTNEQEEEGGPTR
jgi:hypothetical protein